MAAGSMMPCSRTTMDVGQWKAVGDDEAGAAIHQAVHAALYQSLGAGVDVASRG